MEIKKIERPIAREICYAYPRTIEDLKLSSHDIPWKNFNYWFDTHITPLNEAIENGVEVYTSCKDGERHWSSIQNSEDEYIDTHKAILIGITEIKKATPEDILKELIQYDNDLSSSSGSPARLNSIVNKAKAALGDK